MPVPELYTAVEINGKWYLVRTLRMTGSHSQLKWRWWLAWKVFIGKFAVVRFMQDVKPIAGNVTIGWEEDLSDKIDREFFEIALDTARAEYRQYHAEIDIGKDISKRVTDESW